MRVKADRGGLVENYSRHPSFCRGTLRIFSAEKNSISLYNFLVVYVASTNLSSLEVLLVLTTLSSLYSSTTDHPSTSATVDHL